jgi:hypothetical protein
MNSLAPYYYFFYILSVPIGFLLTAHFLRMKKKLFFVEYALVFLLPLGSAYFLYKLDGFRVIVVFFSWLVLGPFLEALVGYTYLGITNRHLWIYERYSILNRTTSYLSAPFWAFAGLGMWAFNELLKVWVK